MSISSIHSSVPAYTPPAPVANLNARAPDGDLKARAAGTVKDSDGDFKPVNSASIPSASNAVQQALSNLKLGG
jgi:hypothetical protein